MNIEFTVSAVIPASPEEILRANENFAERRQLHSIVDCQALADFDLGFLDVVRFAK